MHNYFRNLQEPSDSCECYGQWLWLCTGLVLFATVVTFRFVWKEKNALTELEKLEVARKRQVGVKGNNTTLIPWLIKFNELKLIEPVAEGSSGAVYRGSWLGTTVAIKLPHKHISQLLKEKFVDEAHMMSKLHHPNIVIFLGACLDEPNLALVLEFLEKGSMHDFMKNPKQNIDFAMLHKFAVDIARGMKYLHLRCDIIQRDLKPRNLLIDSADNVKICDFGLSRSRDLTDNTMTACGTPYWTAPEVILQKDYNGKADVFSFAIILWELVTREEPYQGRPGLEVALNVAHNGLRPQIPQYCPEGYNTLIAECWNEDPELRPDFGEILNRLMRLKKTESTSYSGTQETTPSPDHSGKMSPMLTQDIHAPAGSSFIVPSSRV